MSEHPPFPTDRETLEREAQMSFFRAGGPGGQHRNKVETGVRLFHPPSGIRVAASERRSQAQNRELAFERLAEALEKRNRKPTPRKATRPTRASVKRRREDKRKRGEVKRRRSSLDD